MESIIKRDNLFSILLLIATIGDFIVPYILSIFYKGYSHKLEVMSSLGNPISPVKTLYNSWLIILGVLLILTTPYIFSKYYLISKSVSVATIILIIMFAFGAGIISGLFSVNENKEIVTTASKVHGISAAIGFMALLFVPLLLSILEYKSRNKMSGSLFAICFVLELIFFILFIMSDKPSFKNTWINSEGLWQRLSLLFMYLPLVYISIEKLYSSSLTK